MTLRADLERLHGLGPVLQGLADEAESLRTNFYPMCTIGGPQPSVTEAMSISSQLVDATLVDALRERLSETGEIMMNVAAQFRQAEDAGADAEVASTLTDATGAWDVPEVSDQ